MSKIAKGRHVIDENLNRLLRGGDKETDNRLHRSKRRKPALSTALMGGTRKRGGTTAGEEQ